MPKLEGNLWLGGIYYKAGADDPRGAEDSEVVNKVVDGVIIEDEAEIDKEELKALCETYKESHPEGKNPPNNKKNNKDRLLEKIDGFLGAE